MKLFICFLMMLFAAGCKSQPALHINSESFFEKRLTEFKKNEKVEGMAFALFDNETIIWQKCLGKSSYGYPINDETLFSIQSISKNITALAVMKAVQDSLLDMYTPLSKYLTDFTVNSCFEKNPEEKITLKMLLTHTSGLTHEAPVGNNYDYTECSFEEHLLSIRDTWLKFPAGQGYSYSNLGYDVAASVIEKMSGMTFNEYLQSRIFEPLNMKRTTLDHNHILSSPNKTEGFMRAAHPKHLCNPLIGSGAVYTNLSDFIKYVQLHMNFGKTGNAALIDRDHLLDMYQIRHHNYGLGTYIDKINQVYFINHNGSGYGYSASFVWYPEFNLGAVLMCSKQVNTFDLCNGILNDYINRADLQRNHAAADELDYYNEAYFSRTNEMNTFAPYSCSRDTLFKEDWNQYSGKYAMILKGLEFKWYARLAFSLGFHPLTVTIEKRDQKLFIMSSYGKSKLGEYKPGIFFTDGGELVDFKSDIPAYKNIKLKKIQ